MTSIEWTDETWNPTVGCSRVSAGCENCYAERVAARGMQDAHRGLTVKGPNGPRWTGEVRLLPDRLDQPLHWREPRRVFVDSMSDLFHKDVPDEFIDRVFAIAALCLRHAFQIPTKRPERMCEWVTKRSTPAQAAGTNATKWPLPNVWLGVSAENQAAANERIPFLLQTPAAVRFLSLEPLLGPVRVDDIWDGAGGGTLKPLVGLHWGMPEIDGGTRLIGGQGPRIHWVIVGGESGPGARPCHVEWIRSIVEQCRAAGVPVFVKQLGARPLNWCAARLQSPEMAGDYEPDFCDLFEAGEGGHCGSRCIFLQSRKGGDPGEWPEDLRVREMPG